MVIVRVGASFTGEDALSIEAEFQARAGELVEAGRFLHARGWVPATSGNLSARLSDGTFAITVSGRHKGTLTPNDLMRVDADGLSLDGRTPSAETHLHASIYLNFPNAGAVLHPHSPASVLASRLFRSPLVLRDYELLKAFSGIRTHEATVEVPIFPNDQDIDRLAGTINAATGPDLRAYIIAGHGFYTWGATVAEALRHVEALEYLFDLEVRLQGVRSP